MDKAVMAQAVADEARAAEDCLKAAMNNLTGAYGKAFGRCVSDLYYACYHLASALLASKGIAANSQEAVQKLLALHFVKPAALPADTNARFAELADKRHAADYKSYIPIGSDDIDRFRPWVVAFLRELVRLLGKAMPAAAEKSLLETLTELERLRLE